VTSLLSRIPGYLRDLIRAPGRIAEMHRSVTAEVADLKHQVWMLTGLIGEHRREMQLLLGEMSLPDPEIWREVPKPAGKIAPAANAFPNSCLCLQDSFEQPYFAYWSAQLGYTPRYHRKLWEFVFILQALHERGALKKGAKGLGFGVGSEPLSSWFISKGATITATDMSPEAAMQSGWSATSQHAASIEALRRRDLCPDDLFDRNLSFRSVDMNAVPDDLTGFDFCWSACALEHLGSIEAGLAFIRRSVDTLKPGGWAVHTTEFNVSSNTHTMDVGPTVLFRRDDFERLFAALRADGHEVALMDYDPGHRLVDRYIDVPPYRADPHLKVALAGYSTTSCGIIVRRAAQT